jgi:Tfp pilus assembly protein PilZ
MDLKDKIEKLFDQENLVDDVKKVVHPEPDDRREFSRAGISEDAIALQFSNGAQFAKHYVENVSLGGMFIKTSERRKVGELIDVSFSIPDPSEGQFQFQFQLKARVCRAAPHGLGVEFMNLTEEMRAKLETYVRAVLPKGAEIRTKARQATIDRLENSRAQREETQHRQRVQIKRAAFVLSLMALNVFLAFEFVQESQTKQQMRSVTTSIVISGESFRPAEVVSIEQSQDQHFMIRLVDGRVVMFSSDTKDLQQLPPDLQHVVGLMKSLPTPKPIRTSKNNPSSRVQMR